MEWHVSDKIALDQISVVFGLVFAFESKVRSAARTDVTLGPTCRFDARNVTRLRIAHSS